MSDLGRERSFAYGPKPDIGDLAIRGLQSEQSLLASCDVRLTQKLTRVREANHFDGCGLRDWRPLSRHEG